MAPVFNLFHLSHSWFGLSWEKLNLCQLPEPEVSDSGLTRGSWLGKPQGQGFSCVPLIMTLANMQI